MTGGCLDLGLSLCLQVTLLLWECCLLDRQTLTSMPVVELLMDAGLGCHISLISP